MKFEEIFELLVVIIVVLGLTSILVIILTAYSQASENDKRITILEYAVKVNSCQTKEDRKSVV